jgi:hypothetical protein
LCVGCSPVHDRSSWSGEVKTWLKGAPDKLFFENSTGDSGKLEVYSFAMFYPRFLRILASSLLLLYPLSAAESRLLVVGFLGGRVKHDNAIHQEVQLAAHLREQYPSGLDVELFENHCGPRAHQAILRMLDSDHNGDLSAAEKLKARIVLYGHSWGASEAVATARALQKDGIGVLLTIQVDSVSKRGENDGLIPANVAQAINLYQLDGLLHGRAQIVAADPSRTEILGNFRFDYKTKHRNRVRPQGLEPGRISHPLKNDCGSPVEFPGSVETPPH